VRYLGITQEGVMPDLHNLKVKSNFPIKSAGSETCQIGYSKSLKPREGQGSSGVLRLGPLQHKDPCCYKGLEVSIPCTSVPA
jgi:hypothetical protein